MEKHSHPVSLEELPPGKKRFLFGNAVSERDRSYRFLNPCSLRHRKCAPHIAAVGHRRDDTGRYNATSGGCPASQSCLSALRAALPGGLPATGGKPRSHPMAPSRPRLQLFKFHRFFGWTVWPLGKKHSFPLSWHRSQVPCRQQGNTNQKNNIYFCLRQSK